MHILNKKECFQNKTTKKYLIVSVHKLFGTEK